MPIRKTLGYLPVPADRNYLLTHCLILGAYYWIKISATKKTAKALVSALDSHTSSVLLPNSSTKV